MNTFSFPFETRKVGVRGMKNIQTTSTTGNPRLIQLNALVVNAVSAEEYLTRPVRDKGNWYSQYWIRVMNLRIMKSDKYEF